MCGWKKTVDELSKSLVIGHITAYIYSLVSFLSSRAKKKGSLYSSIEHQLSKGTAAALCFNCLNTHLGWWGYWVITVLRREEAKRVFITSLTGLGWGKKHFITPRLPTPSSSSHSRTPVNSSPDVSLHLSFFISSSLLPFACSKIMQYQISKTLKMCIISNHIFRTTQQRQTLLKILQEEKNDLILMRGANKD